MRPGGSASLWSLLLSTLVVAAAAGQQPGARAPEILVTGRVLERDTGAPIPGARVVLVGTGEERGTDGQGLFEFLRIPAGRYWLHVEHIGYGPADDTVQVPRRGRLELDIRLAPRPVELDAVVASVERSSAPGIRAFYERRRTGPGRYLTRADLSEPGVHDVSDAIRRLPGIRLVPRVRNGITTGHAVQVRGGCAAMVYVDGIVVDSSGPTIDEILVPDEVEGVEIYSGVETPVGFSSNGCGAVLIWTRSGGGEGVLPFWKGLLYAGAFVASAVLLVIAF